MTTKTISKKTIYEAAREQGLTVVDNTPAEGGIYVSSELPEIYIVKTQFEPIVSYLIYDEAPVQTYSIPEFNELIACGKVAHVSMEALMRLAFGDNEPEHEAESVAEDETTYTLDTYDKKLIEKHFYLHVLEMIEEENAPVKVRTVRKRLEITFGKETANGAVSKALTLLKNHGMVRLEAESSERNRIYTLTGKGKYVLDNSRHLF